MKRRKLNRKDNLDLEMPKHNNGITLEMPKYKWEKKVKGGFFAGPIKRLIIHQNKKKKIKQKESEIINDGKMETRQ